uniref:Endosomal/lysosomal proton channel TMEM175 n=2 Tax=Paramormyrops kingsleyae TaxID=1676925 RepID=A0A3B3Q7R3_9TELE|nr:endosomal/lysosomal potassium channel TMEM175-like isoform X1 [Paramormyrops kingsleyae]
MTLHAAARTARWVIKTCTFGEPSKKPTAEAAPQHPQYRHGHHCSGQHVGRLQMAGSEDAERARYHHGGDEEREGDPGRRPASSLSESEALLDKDEHSSTQSSHRLLAYSDALISIIATVMILPVAHTKLEDDEELHHNLELLLTTKIAVYLMSFLLVSMAWSAHTRLFEVITRVDDCLSLLNLACMMLITFLPYTFSLIAAFPDNILGLNLFCACVMMIGLMQAAVVLYGFSHPRFLNETHTLHKRHILKVILRVPLLCLIAASVSFVCIPLSFVTLVFAVFLPYISQSLKRCYRKLIGMQTAPPTDAVGHYSYHPWEPLSKERLEGFTDGVYAIVATLLILDICEDNIPEPSELKDRFNGSLTVALQEYGPNFLAYFGSFATVGLLWCVHHSLFLHVVRPTRTMGLLNTFSLAFVGGLPLCYQLTHELPQSSLNEREAVQISCVILFLAGFFQLAIWVVALAAGGGALHPYVHYRGRNHAFMLAKLALYPCAALGTFCLASAPGRSSAFVFHLMGVTVPLAFLVLRYAVQAWLALLRLLRSKWEGPLRESPTPYPVTGAT